MILQSAYYSEKDPFGIFDRTDSVKSVRGLYPDAALILWGGEDISPSLYNQPLVHAHASDHCSMRDIVERNLFEEAVALGRIVLRVSSLSSGNSPIFANSLSIGKHLRK